MLSVNTSGELSQSSGKPILAFIGVRPGVSPIDDSIASAGNFGVESKLG